MNDVKKMIAQRERQIKKAKKKSISASLENGLKEYLIDWLLDHQVGITKQGRDVSIQMYLITAMEHMREIIDLVDDEAEIELLWVGEETSMDTLKLDGVRVTWCDEVAAKRNESQLQVDSSTLLLREIGVE